MNLEHEWANVARKVLACAINDKGAAVVSYEALAGKSFLFPVKERAIWNAIDLCFAQNQPPLVDAVVAHSNGNSGYIRTIAGTFNRIDNLNLEHNLKLLVEFGLAAYTRQLGSSLASVTPENMIELASKVANELAGLESLRNQRDPSAVAIDDILWQRLENSPWQPVSTGIVWLDKLTHGGLWPTMNYWFVAPYKSYKTSIARNITLHAGRQGKPVVFIAAEGERSMFVLDCEIMLATEFLIENGEHFTDIRMDSLFVLGAMAHNRAILTPLEHQALEYGRQTFRQLPIYTFDSSDGIRSLATLRHIIRRCRVEYQAELFWLDYSQLFGDGKMGLVERQDLTAATVQEVASTSNVAIAVISQQNEEQVKAGNKSHSPGVKGGGGAPAAADGLFVSQGDADNPFQFTLQSKLGRRFSATKPYLHLISKSGLIVDRWYQPEIHTL